MGEGWPLVPFADCMERVERRIILDDVAEYETVGVRWYGQGAFLRERQLGAQIARKQQWVIHEGDIVYNKLFAWKGAFAVADASVHGRIVSDKFPTYRPVPQLLDPRYLAWWFRAPAIAKQAESMSKGAAAISKLTLNPPQFWRLTIPLPPVEEQRRIVARVEAIAAKVEEAQRLRRAAEMQRRVLFRSAAHVLLETLDAPRRELGRLVSVRGGGTPSKANPFYWGGSIPWISPKDMKAREMFDSIDHITDVATRESPAKLVPPGAVLVVVRGMILAHTVPAATLRVPAAVNQDIKALIPNEGLAAEYITAVLWVLNADLLNLVEKSTHDTRKLETDKLLAFPIPVPSLEAQQQFLSDLAQIEGGIARLGALADETEHELSAVLPALLDRAFRGEL